MNVWADTSWIFVLLAAAAWWAVSTYRAYRRRVRASARRRA